MSSSTTDRRMKAIQREMAEQPVYESFINGGVHKNRARVVFGALVLLVVCYIAMTYKKSKTRS